MRETTYMTHDSTSSKLGASAEAWLLAPLDPLLRRRPLTVEFTRRDVLGRYRGATLGIVWSLLTPAMMLLVFGVAFGGVFRSQWSGEGFGEASYVLILYVGLVVHSCLGEAIARSPTAISGNPNFVKRVVFPLDIIPWSIALSAYFHVLVNLLVLVVLVYIDVGKLGATMLLAPVVALPLVPVAIAIGLVLSALGVYVRDIAQVTGVVVTALLFLSSAVLPASGVPDTYRWIFELNPLTFIIDQMRIVLILQQVPDWAGLGWYTVRGLAAMWVAHAWFRFARRGFADVI
jgi:lipopolysaccharide transport system permease protein